MNIINRTSEPVIVGERQTPDGNRVLEITPQRQVCIRVHRHATEGEAPQLFEAASIGEWLLQHYGEVPGHGVYVYAGEPSQETDLTGDVPALLRNDAPLYVVLETPGIPAAYGVWAVIGNMAISMAISYAVSAILAPKTKSLDNRSQESPNNALSSRENRVRLLERVEDIFGTVRSIPSLMMQTYSKYIENRRVEYALMCVGRGYCHIEDVREGDTDLASITGASAEFYHPFTSPNSGSPILTIGDAITDPVLQVTRSSGVDGLVLKAHNQIQLQPGLGYYFIGAGYAGSGDIPANPTGYDTVFQPIDQRRPNLAAVAEVGQTLTIVMSPALTRRVIDAPPHYTQIFSASKTIDLDAGSAGFWAGAVVGQPIIVSGLGGAYDGTYTIASFNATQLVVVEPIGGGVDLLAVMAGTYDITVDYSGTRTINEVGNAYVRLAGTSVFATTPTPISGSFLGAPAATLNVDNGLSEWTDWVTLPDPERTESWTNVVALQGMYRDDGSKSGTSVAYEVQIEQLTALLVPTGTVETVTGEISGAASNERAETLERVTAWVGPARVRMRRTTQFDYTFEGLVNDEITWVDLYGVVPVTTPHFGNKTIVHTVTRATPNAVRVQRREFNCLASRWLPLYDGTSWTGAFNADGLLVSGYIGPTSRICEILAAVTIDPQIGDRPLSDLDFAQIWNVQGLLGAWHAEVGQFNYTFDSDGLSFEDTVNAIADAAFCRAYRQNGQIRLALDRPQTISVALITHRNKKPKSEAIIRRFASDADYDGVELVYMDPETETQETIRLPLGGGFTKLKKVEVSGIRSYEQAWFRANREYQRMRLQRLSIETECTADARALLPNSRIDIVDNTRFKSYDGEVIGQSGLTLTLSRDVQFIPATAHSIILQKRDGSLQSIACTAGAAANQVVLAGAPAEALVTYPDPDAGIRTTFSFGADSARDAQGWLVQEISALNGGYATIRAVNYSAGYYAADEEDVPAKAGVIN